MGSHYSQFNQATLESFIAQEYERQHQLHRKRDFLVLSDMVNGMGLDAEYRFNMCHLGMLFMMDKNKDGRFTMDDLQLFGRMAIDTIQEKGFKTHELLVQMQAHCTLMLWHEICGT